MTYIIFIFSLIITITGAIIVNSISKKAKKIRDKLTIESNITEVDVKANESFEEDYVLKIEHLLSLYMELKQQSHQDKLNNQSKFDNIHKTLNNLNKQIDNTDYSGLLRDNDMFYSNRGKLEKSYLN